MGHERCCAQVVISIDDLMPAPLLGELQIVLVGEPGFPVDDDCHGCTQLTTNYSTRDTVDTASRKDGNTWRWRRGWSSGPACA